MQEIAKRFIVGVPRGGRGGRFLPHEEMEKVAGGVNWECVARYGGRCDIYF